MKKRLLRILTIAVILAAAGAGVYAAYSRYLMSEAEKAAADSRSPDKLYTVKRGELTIGVLLSGSINTKIKHKLSSDVPRNMKLVSVVDENAKVTKGEIMARFETEDLQTVIDDLKEKLSNAEKDILILREERAILVSSNEADIKTAKDSVTDALAAFNKFRKLEGPRDKDNQSQKVSDAYKTLTDAQTAYDTAYDNLYKPENSVDDEATKKTLQSAHDSALKSLNSAKNSYNSTLLDRKIFKRYTHPNNAKNLRDKLERAELDLKKVIIRTQSSLIQKDNQIYNSEATIKRYERDLEQNLWFMTRMQLISPVDGIVTYGDPDRRWGNTEVKVGMDVYRRVVLLTIPDMSNMVIDTNIPELFRSKVEIGANVVITPDSVPNLKIRGRIATISALPVFSVAWDQSSQKIYRSTIEFIADDPRIVSGMNVQVEVVSKVLKDIIYIPIEAVQEKGGRFFVYRDASPKPEEVDVELGLSNDSYVEIKSGLEENDAVYLYRPYQQDKTE